jgi:hypothetical protein
MIATWAAELMVHRIVALELASPSVLPVLAPAPVPVPVTALGGQVNKGFSSRALTPSGPGDSDGNNNNSKLIASAVSDFKDFLRRYKYVRTSIFLEAHEYFLLLHILRTLNCLYLPSSLCLVSSVLWRLYLSSRCSEVSTYTALCCSRWSLTQPNPCLLMTLPFTFTSITDKSSPTLPSFAQVFTGSRYDALPAQQQVQRQQHSSGQNLFVCLFLGQ